MRFTSIRWTSSGNDWFLWLKPQAQTVCICSQMGNGTGEIHGCLGISVLKLGKGGAAGTDQSQSARAALGVLGGSLRPEAR